MIEITDKSKCCGCTACASACPQNAINMSPDEEGFLYPFVDTQLCINCNICNNVCTVLNKQVRNDFNIESYVIRTKESNVLRESTSGGFITPLANYVFEREGVFCASAYSNNFEVKHIIIESTNGSCNNSFDYWGGV